MGGYFQRYPLLRLIVAFACGVVLGDKLYLYVGSLLMWALLICVCALVFMICTYANSRMIWNAFYGVAVSVVFLSLGVARYAVQRDSMHYEWNAERMVYEARVMDIPRDRAKSVLCEMRVNAVRDTVGWHAVGQMVFAYFQPCAAVDSLLPGDVVCFEGSVATPCNFSDDLNFDYARYVTMQGGSGTVYLPIDSWSKVGCPCKYSLREKLLRLRSRLLEKYMGPAFDGDELGVLAALTMGDRRALGNELRTVYADAGVAHALALSGLHVGVIYMMLSFFMRGIVRKRSLRWICELLCIGVLWLFAVMVGLSASVVRAVSMYTLYALSRWLSKDGASVGVLSLAAMAMLLVCPLYLFDVGFQLSYMAVVAILLVEPYFEYLFLKPNLPRVLSYFVGVVCVSLSAQLGTFPLSLYHFGTFPLYFLLTNLLVVPMLPIVLSLGVVWWGLVLMGIPWASWIGESLQCIVHWMNECLVHISQWPGAVLRVTDFNALSVLFLYLFMSFVVLFVGKKWPKGFILALVSLLGLLISFMM